MERRYTVSALTAEIKEIIELGFSRIYLEGEISNSRPASSGHWYFTLKDPNAVISAVMFRTRIASLDFQPQDGMQVLVGGSLSLYEKRGNYQIICETMKQAGTGTILLTLEERRLRLAAEGLFDAAKKKDLPRFPRRVAIVTSPTGAAIRDILQVLGRRAEGLDVVIVPAPVQGIEAGAKLAAALRQADRHQLGDVIILARGGGSVEDLLPFSDEVLVRAIADCRTPVISAVGHETDTSLSDFAADLRAPTPSAAAELVVQSREELLRRVMTAGHNIAAGLLSRRRQLKQALRPFSSVNLETSFLTLLHPRMQRLDDAKELMIDGLRATIRHQRSRIQSLHDSLQALSPWDVLRRGYAIVSNETGTIFGSAAKAHAGAISIRWHDGQADGMIKSIQIIDGEQNR